MTTLEIVQTRWHIEDKTIPSKGQVYREAVDLYTDAPALGFRIKEYYVNLKVINKNNGMELPFLCEGEWINVNLCPELNCWPSKDGLSSKIKHVKLEVEYTDVHPKFEPQIIMNTFPRLGYDNTFDINGTTQPEFYLTVPLGMKLRNKGKNTELLLKIKDEKKSKRLRFYEDVHTDYIRGMNTYRFLIKEKSYALIDETPDEKIEHLRIHYSVTNELKFWFFPIFPVILIVLGILDFVYGKHDDPNFAQLTYTIIFISFITYYITLLKDGYEVPWNKFVIIATPFAGILLIVPILVTIFINNCLAETLRIIFLNGMTFIVPFPFILSSFIISILIKLGLLLGII